jgi:hypothetical protein
VVIVAPLGRRSGVLPGADKQAGDLRAAGARVVVVSPDQPARKAIGLNILDRQQRATAARAGRAQAAAVAADVRDVWRERIAGRLASGRFRPGQPSGNTEGVARRSADQPHHADMGAPRTRRRLGQSGLPAHG